MSEKPFYTRVALVGVGMYLFIAALLVVPILIFQPADIGFPIFVAVPALVIGALIYFVQPWGLVAAVLGGLIGLLFFSAGADLALSSPQSFFDFAFTLFTLPGAIILLIGGIGGLVQHFQHRTSPSGSPTVTMALKGVLGVIAVLCLISVVLTVAGIGGVSAAEREGATIVKAKETKFDTDSISASASGGKIVVENKDVVLHTFTVDDLDIDVKVGPGAEKLIELNSRPVGSYEFYCRIVGHEDMKGTLTIR